MLEANLHDDLALRYQVTIIDKAFRTFSKTVMIAFLDENLKKVEEFKFGYVSMEEIEQWIDEGKDINLNNSYIHNFSLTDYRVNKGLDDSVYVKLNNFSAKKAFFDCDIKSDLSYAEFIGDKILFDQAIFSNGGADFNHANFGIGDVSFKKAKFGTGLINFQFAEFDKGSITFTGACLGHGNTSFVSTNFGSGSVDFKNMTLGNGNLDMKFAKFADGDVNFEKVQFGVGKKDFKNLEFGGGKIDFRRVNFNDGEVNFEGVEFGDGKVSFRSATFGKGDIYFDLADFGKGDVQFDLVDFGSGKTSFNKCKAETVSFQGCPLNTFMDLRFSQCKVIELRNTIVRDIVDLMPDDEPVNIQEFNISGMRILGRIFIDWRKNNVMGLIYNQKQTNYYQKAEQLRILKENFRNNGQYEDEDVAYIEFKRCESKAILIEALAKDRKNALWAYPNYYFQKYVFDYIGRYGTAPTRVLNNMVITFTSFAGVYYLFSHFFPSLGIVATTLPTELKHEGEFWNSMYYSCITFFTIGYGDYFAEGWLKPVAAFEGFSGVFLMSYFTVAFVRKILR